MAAIQRISAAEAALERGVEGTLYQDKDNPALFYVRGVTGTLADNAMAAGFTAAQVAALVAVSSADTVEVVIAGSTGYTVEV